MGTNNEQVLTVISKYFEDENATSYWPDTESQPDLVVVTSNNVVVAFDCFDGDISVSESRKNLNQKIRGLRSDDDSDESFYRVLVNLSDQIDTKLTDASSLLSLSAIVDEHKLLDLLPSTSSNNLANSIVNWYSPVILFSSKVRRGASDSGKNERDELRFRLDEEQTSAALVDHSEVIQISGPPGSGKTLVLAARARWLAQSNPRWRIVFVCYNKSLVSYIKNLVSEFKNIEVMTFNRLAEQSGARFGTNEESNAAIAYSKAKRAGIGPVCDAILIDEWQDFCPSWIKFCFDVVRQDRGGMTVAGDKGQAIYQDSEPSRALIGHEVKKIVLKKPYRSTRQILAFTQALDGDFKTDGHELAVEGEPVDLVYADDWDGQADAALWEIGKILSIGQWKPRDIAVLATRKSLIARMETRLNDQAIAFTADIAELDGDNDNIAEPLFLSTVHSAKGLEFDVVILIGLDAIEHKLSDPDDSQKVRIGYVGPTRARDQLIAIYSKTTSLIDRLRDDSALELRRWNYPDDIEGAS